MQRVSKRTTRRFCFQFNMLSDICKQYTYYNFRLLYSSNGDSFRNDNFAFDIKIRILTYVGVAGMLSFVIALLLTLQFCLHIAGVRSVMIPFKHNRNLLVAALLVLIGYLC